LSTSPGKPPAFRFTIRDVLWLTVCVAMFLGGRYLDTIAKQVHQPRDMQGPTLRLSKGTSGAVSTNLPHDRMLVSDPTLVSIVPMTPTKFLVTAKAKGTTTITVWEHESGRPIQYAVVVDE